MPDFVRRAIEAQGKVDPDDVAKLAAVEDYEYEEGGGHELPPIPEEPEQEVMDVGYDRPDWA